MTTKALKTGEQIKEELYAKGESLRSWATKNKYSYPMVCKVADGTLKGLRGKSREVAIKLGVRAA